MKRTEPRRPSFCSTLLYLCLAVALLAKCSPGRQVPAHVPGVAGDDAPVVTAGADLGDADIDHDSEDSGAPADGSPSLDVSPIDETAGTDVGQPAETKDADKFEVEPWYPAQLPLLRRRFAACSMISRRCSSKLWLGADRHRYAKRNGLRLSTTRRVRQA